MTFGRDLPDYPWEALAPHRATAAEHPGGVVDLSIGTPVDDTPEVVRAALRAHDNAPGYPTTHGMPELREAVADWFGRRRGVPGLDPDAVLPTVGSKEIVAWLPLLLGLGADDVVVYPEAAYPTYAMGAQIARVRHQAASSPEDWPGGTRLVWVNSPSNPTGAVQDRDELRGIVAAARERGIVVASDECYAELGWGRWEDELVPSLLDPYVSGGSHDGLLCAYSLSKQSNLAGYRAAFLAGDKTLIANLVNTRKHAGMIVPAPVQHAMIAALGDDGHVAAQKAVYRARRELLRPALERAGFRIDHSEAGLYLWCTRGEDAWDSIAWFAERGILAGPGVFYGQGGTRHVRVALTGTDERIAAAVERLS